MSSLRRETRTPGSVCRVTVRPGRVPARRVGAPLLAAALLTVAACSDTPTAPIPGEAAYSTSGGPLSVWWPTEDAWLEGVQPFQARMDGWPLSDYRLFWQVDGGKLNEMHDSHEGGPHKRALVDVTAWDWRGSGPYKVTLEARARRGNRVLGRTSVSVQVGPGPDGPGPGAGPGAPSSGASPLAVRPFYIDPYSNARRQADEWRDSRPDDAALMDRIAERSQADWFGDWSGDIRAAVDARTTTIAAAGALPVFVAYNIPLRDCSSYSGGGARNADDYRAWIRAFAAGIGDRTAAVILEPDAVALMDCLSSTQRSERLTLLRDAVEVLKARPGVLVYIDAGHSAWLAAATAADRLRDAGVALADGFALNTSNFQTTAHSLPYGEAVSGRLGGARFVLDTSRNGNGPTGDNQWCNPAGRALGANPTAQTGHELVDAFLWIKRPGESDGSCNGGPSAGAWWADYALGLAARQPAILASGY
jgi:endoglucanase